jgi:hypothetical protein
MKVKFSEILFDLDSGVLAVLVMIYKFILYRLVISHLMLAVLLKMNRQRLLLMKTDLNQNFVWYIL